MLTFNNDEEHFAKNAADSDLIWFDPSIAVDIETT